MGGRVSERVWQQNGRQKQIWEVRFRPWARVLLRAILGSNGLGRLKGLSSGLSKSFPGHTRVLDVLGLFKGLSPGPFQEFPHGLSTACARLRHIYKYGSSFCSRLSSPQFFSTHWSASCCVGSFLVCSSALAMPRRRSPETLCNV